MKAPDILARAAAHMAERAKTYDSPDGERSMAAAVRAFNAITGRAITEAQGWLLFQLVKDVRLFSAPGYHADSAEDGVSYAALKGEAKAREGGEPDGWLANTTNGNAPDCESVDVLFADGRVAKGLMASALRWTILGKPSDITGWLPSASMLAIKVGADGCVSGFGQLASSHGAPPMALNSAEQLTGTPHPAERGPWLKAPACHCTGPGDRLVEVELRGGGGTMIRRASVLRWGHAGMPGDIMRYRWALTVPAKPDGEGWMDVWPGAIGSPCQYGLTVEIQHRDGRRLTGLALSFDWTHLGSESDIVRFRVVE